MTKPTKKIVKKRKGPSAPSTMFGNKAKVVKKGVKKSDWSLDVFDKPKGIKKKPSNLTKALNTLLNYEDEKSKATKKSKKDNSVRLAGLSDAIKTVAEDMRRREPAKAIKGKKQAKPKERTPGEKRVDKIVDKMKANKKPPVSSTMKKKSKAVAELERVAEENRKSFAAWANAPCFGDAIIVPDAKGFDGHSDLTTFGSMDRELRKKLNSTNLKVKEKALIEFDRLTVRNAWQWINWCERLWFETQNSEIPTKRLVVIPLEDLIPHTDIDFHINRLRNSGDFKQAIGTLGFLRHKVRIIPRIEAEEVKAKTLNWMNDLMSQHTGIKTIQGFYLPNVDMDDIPREIAFGAIPHQRKLAYVERFIDELIENKQRAVIKYETLRLLGSKISEIKETVIYKKLKQSWGLQNPLIEVTSTASESKVRKISRLGDIIIGSTGE